MTLLYFDLGTSRLNGRIAAFSAAAAECDDLGVPKPHPLLRNPPLFQAEVIERFAKTERQLAPDSKADTAPDIRSVVTAILSELQVPANASASAASTTPYINLALWRKSCEALPADVASRPMADVDRQLLMGNVSAATCGQVKRDPHAFAPPTPTDVQAGKALLALQYPVHRSTSDAYDERKTRPPSKRVLCPTFDYLGRAVSKTLYTHTYRIDANITSLCVAVVVCAGSCAKGFAD